MTKRNTNSKKYSEDLRKAVEVLKSGGVILYPTDTIWGLGCDATNDKAVERIFEIKGRPEGKSLIILATEDMLADYTEYVPDVAWQLIDITTTPLTLIYSKGKNLAQRVLADDGSVGIRIPQDDFCLDLLHRFGKPIVSTSANFSGSKPPVNFLDIDEELKKQVDYIVKWRQNDRRRAKPSSIIKVEGKDIIKIIRQ